MKKALWVLFIMLTIKAFPQKKEFMFLFEGIGDNREFFSSKSTSQTILGSRGAFELGFSHDFNRLSFGLSNLYEFGSYISYHKPQVILYYQYKDDRKVFRFGAFPRRGVDELPQAINSDTLQYYRPIMEGMHGEYRWQLGRQSVFIDWTGRQETNVREAFTVGSSGRLGTDHFFIDNHFVLNHLAGSKVKMEDEHVNDNLGYLLQAGLKTYNDIKWSGYLKAGILGSLYRERSVTDGLIHRQSLLAEGYLKYRNFAARTSIHSGQGHNFLHGDPFYKLNNYSRTDIIWYFINHENVKGRFNLSFHLIEWNDLDQSQQLSIIYIIPFR